MKTILFVGSMAFHLLPFLVSAQYFGQNKIGYDTFNFKVSETPNFAIHHYTTNDSALTYWAVQAEQWYRKFYHVLGDSIDFKNPIILYNDHADFQQTNVTPTNIDPSTGGFAEGLKNRVVLPIMKSNAQTNHVLGHEIAHALQFQMVAKQDSLSLSDMMRLPLWFVEGMAEYLSIGAIDSHTALWLRDAVLQNELPTLNDLTFNPNFFPYRWGHAFWAFVTGRYGDKVIRPLFIAAARWDYATAIARTLHVSVSYLEQEWHQSIRNSYEEGLTKKNNWSGQRLFTPNSAGAIQIAPSLSPDGKKVAFFSEKNLFSLDLFVADVKSQKVLRKLASTSRFHHLDALSYLESTGTWSPDSKKFMFTAYSKGRNRLVIVNVSNGTILEEIEIPGVPAFSNPSWSPDGDMVVLNGLVNGQNDLYIYHLTTKEVKQLTDNLITELQPNWSPDGRMVVFSTDAVSKRDPRPLVFDHQIEVIDVLTKVHWKIPVFEGADNLNPNFGTDNQLVYFLSNHDGNRNIYAYNLFKERLYKLTDYATGVSGITPHAPALSVAKQTGQVVYTLFQDQSYITKLVESTEFLWAEMENVKASDRNAILPPNPRFMQDFVSARINASIPSSTIQRLEEMVGEGSPYRSRLRLAGISGGGQGGAGISSNRLGTNLQGGATAYWTDMLGDKELSFGLALTGEIANTSGQITYMNKKNRINWGLGVSHVGFSFFSQGAGFDTLTTSSGTDVLARTLFNTQERTFEQTLSFYSYLPLSRTRRIEFSASSSRFFFSNVRSVDYFVEGEFVLNERFRLPTGKDIFTGSISAAFVGDNSYMGQVSPLRGERFRLGVESSFGPIVLQSVNLDYRRYFRLSPFTIALRGLHLGRYGRDAISGILPPLALGTPTIIRGYTIDAFLNAPRGNTNIRPFDLLGRSIAVANAEVRFPLSGNPQLAPIRSGMFASELALFLDAGWAWGEFSSFVDRPVRNESILDINSLPISSAGVSLRVNLVGAIILEPFLAVPWNLGGFQNTSFGLNFAAGW